ncbi:MAG: c-type cytochrome [Pseudohongiellaceae bacterium]
MRKLVPLFLLVLLGPAMAAEEGREPYDNLYCDTCHGADGIGNEGVQAPRLAGMEPWYLRRQLQNFREGIRGMHPQDTQGLAMQPMAAKLNDAEIDEVIEWVETWDYVPAEPTIAGNATAGRQAYRVCASCHGANGEGVEALGAPQLAGQNDWYLITQLQNFSAGYRGAHPQDPFGQQMIPMARTLRNDEAVRNVVAYISTLSGD